MKFPDYICIIAALCIPLVFLLDKPYWQFAAGVGVFCGVLANLLQRLNA